MSGLLITNISEIATPKPTTAGPLKGSEQSKITTLHDAYVRVEGKHIVDVGVMADLADQGGLTDQHVLDAQGQTVIPGLVDPHTHACFAGWRVEEFAARLRGATYKEILEAGGGILSTMVATRSASEEELLQATMGYLDEMLQQGTTTAEVKSGYGLALHHELKQLRVINEAQERHSMDIVPTFLGAHAVPPEYKDKPSVYISHIVDDMLPAVAEERLARFVDVFCEPGVFTVEESRELLSAALGQGFQVRMHADELEYSGGAVLAAELGAASADHLLAAGDEGTRALASTNTMAILLPATALMLGLEPQDAGRKLVDQGAAVALATDFNPGSSPTTSMLLVMALGSLMLGLTPEEALVASTLNAAVSLGYTDRGVVAPGYIADLLLLDCPGYEHIAYRPGVNFSRRVIKHGKMIG